MAPSHVLSVSNLTVKTWGGPFDDYGTGVAVDSSGNSYLVGTTYSFGVGGSDVFLVKYNSSNSLVWQRTWGGRLDDGGYGVASNSSGDVYVTGVSCSFTVNCDTILLKFNSSGNLLWQKGIEGITVGSPSLAIGPMGGAYLVIGSDWGGATSALIERFDSAGNLIWNRNWTGLYRAYPFGIASDSAGNVNIAGQAQIISPTAYKTYAFLLHFDALGELLWQRIWVSKTSASYPLDSANGVAVDSVGDVYVTGTTYLTRTVDGSQITSQVAFLSKFNSTGSLSWEETWSTNYGYSNAPASLGIDTYGNVYVTGTTYPISYLLEFTPNGVLLAQQQIRGPRALSLASNFTSNVYVAATVSSTPPYALCSLTGSTRTVNVTQVTGSSAIGYYGGSPVTLSGNVTAPAANQSYAGANDAALLSYSPLNVGVLPSCSSLATSPILYLTTFLLITPFVIRAKRKP